MTDPCYQRVLLKLSGEALSPQSGNVGPLSKECLERICSEIRDVQDKGYQICLVVGGGNILRGATTAASLNLEKGTADHMGMLATAINALALQSCLENMGVSTRVQSAITMIAVAEPYIRRRAIRHMEKNRVVIFAGGTGNPFFTTDTAAILRAVETHCDVVIKGTAVDGVYSVDPKNNQSAKKYHRLSYMQVLTEGLNVMDAAAIALAQDNKMPILVCNIHQPGNLEKVLSHSCEFSIITSSD